MTSVSAGSTGPLSVGVAKVDLTPADLTALNPLGGTSFIGVHDPLFARVLLLRAGSTEAALISVDLIECGDMRPLRARIATELGIPAGQVMIAATHTHNAPRLGTVSPGALAHNGGPESARYTEEVYDKLVGALREAQAEARPARFGVGSGHCAINVNRELYRDGAWTLGHNPDGPTDPRVWVLRFESLEGEQLAVVSNYAVHSTVALWTREVSADLAGAAMRHVEDALGGVALFLPGALGDQAPRVSLESRGPGGFGPHGRLPTDAERAFAYEAVAAQGFVLGAEIVRVVGGIDRLSAAVRLRTAAQVIPSPVKTGVDVLASMVQEQVSAVDLTLTLLQLDDVALAGVGGEVTTNVYRQLAARSPLAATILVSLANDRIGYLPDDAAFDRPVHSVNGCPIARGHAEAAIVDGLNGLIRESSEQVV